MQTIQINEKGEEEIKQGDTGSVLDITIIDDSGDVMNLYGKEFDDVHGVIRSYKVDNELTITSNKCHLGKDGHLFIQFDTDDYEQLLPAAYYLFIEFDYSDGKQERFYPMGTTNLTIKEPILKNGVLPA